MHTVKKYIYAIMIILVTAIIPSCFSDEEDDGFVSMEEALNGKLVYGENMRAVVVNDHIAVMSGGVYHPEIYPGNSVGGPYIVSVGQKSDNNLYTTSDGIRWTIQPKNTTTTDFRYISTSVKDLSELAYTFLGEPTNYNQMIAKYGNNIIFSQLRGRGGFNKVSTGYFAKIINFKNWKTKAQYDLDTYLHNWAHQNNKSITENILYFVWEFVNPVLVEFQGKMFLIGGGDTVKKINRYISYTYDFKTFTTVLSNRERLGNSAILEANGKLYSIGGLMSADSYDSEKIIISNLIQVSEDGIFWQNLKDQNGNELRLPYGLTGCRAVLHNGYIYIYGGEKGSIRNDAKYAVYSRSVYRFNPSFPQYIEEVGFMPKNYRFANNFSVVSFRGQMYVIGGNNIVQNRTTLCNPRHISYTYAASDIDYGYITRTDTQDVWEVCSWTAPVFRTYDGITYTTIQKTDLFFYNVDAKDTSRNTPH